MKSIPALPINLIKLSVAEKVQLTFDIWDHVAVESGSIDLTPLQKKELSKRLRSLHSSGGNGTPWSQVYNKIRLAKS